LAIFVFGQHVTAKSSLAPSKSHPVSKDAAMSAKPQPSCCFDHQFSLHVATTTTMTKALLAQSDEVYEGVRPTHEKFARTSTAAYDIVA